MLTDLHVRDLGVIEDLTLQFDPGMTAVSYTHLTLPTILRV